MKKIEPLIVLILLLCTIPKMVKCQWSNDTNVNTLVTNAENDQREPAIISDGNGGVIITWRDYQFTTSPFGGEIYSQRLNSEGIVQWTSNGIAVNAASLGKGNFKPVMTEDGYGGAVVGWAQTPGSFYNYDIFAQKLNPDGERKWVQNDVTVSDRSGTESFHQITSDDSCGAIFTWAYLPGTPGSTDIYAQRVDSAGVVKWADNGVEICMAAESQSYPQLTGDGSSGAIITWEDHRKGAPESDIYAQKIDSEGALQWANNGVEVANYLYFQGSPVIVTDGSGGAIIAWEDQRAGNSDIYVQRLNGSGEFQWTEHGIPLCSALGDQQEPVIVSDGEGGAIIAWQDQRNGNRDIYAQRINGAGEIQWATNGVAATSAPNDQSAPVAIADNAGGIITAWWDYRSDPLGDIYAQRINASGTPLWNNNGTAVCTASGYQEFPALATNGDEGAIIVWADKRNGTDYDIYAQLIDKTGNTGISGDGDKDGISDTEEQGPDGDNPDYDGNTDGSPDYQQANVASFNTFDQAQYVTLAVPAPSVLEDVKAINNPDPDAQGAPEQGTYPYGFFSFKIKGMDAGGSIMATLFLHDGPEVSSYYKYGPTSTEGIKWYEFDYDGETGAMISEDTVNLYLTDGMRGDYDITADGKIVDPGGPVMVTTSIETSISPGFTLEPIYPNPFDKNTNITFSTNRMSEITIEVFDIRGRIVCTLLNEQVTEGRHVINWDTSGLNYGIYILKMRSGVQSVSRQIIKAK